MANLTVLIIRHADKPESGGDSGVNGAGIPDPKSLTPRGWQRAGVWAEMFAPSLGGDGVLPRPTAIYASAPATHADIAAGNGGSRSQRPLETVAPLAAKLGIQANEAFRKGQEKQLATAVLDTSGIALICWQHEDIAAIATALAPNVKNIPETWPDDRFNVVYVLTRFSGDTEWNFRQVVPFMLRGDGSGELV